MNYREPLGLDEAKRVGLATSCMTAEWRFLDTNVLVYLFDNDAPEKQARARVLLEEEPESIVLSTQVLGEFYVTVTRKLGTPLEPHVALEAVDDLCAFQVRAVGAELLQAAVRRSQLSQLSYWDALIVETALDAGAVVLMTEDLQHGQTFNGLPVIDPFRDD